MRCAQFHRQPKKSSVTVPIKSPPSDQPSTSPAQIKQHQPSDNLPSSPSPRLTPPAAQTSTSSPSPSTSSCKPTSAAAMIRRSQRECSSKIQSQSSTMSSSSTNSCSSSAAASASSASSSSTSSSSSSSSAPKLGTSSAAKSCNPAVAPPPLQSCQTETTVTVKTGGRHPHPPSASNTKLKHKCPFEGCPWRFATPYKLRRHIKSHTKETPYLCKECGRGFSVRYNLLMHIQTIHSQPQKFKCPIRGCKDAFHSQSRLNGHLRRIHKKDWKSLQSAKEGKDTENRGNNAGRGAAMQDPSQASSDGSGRRAHFTVYNCPHCDDEFTSKAKLTAHVKVHAPDKPFKCIVQGCNRCFDSHEKLSRHADSHKNSKQFCCPHRNCNRIFLRQTHLRNHLKSHTQDHHFICPVLDCSQKFASESAYNVHLNSHINYGYSCPHPGCELTFLSRKRLAIHLQVVHHVFTSETGINSPLLDGIQPHLGGHSPSLHSPSSSSPSLLSHPYAHHTPTARRCVLDKEFIRNVDLPGLSSDDIEAVLSENEDWSGEQIDQFLHSAVDLSEIESKLFSMASYESDSGYSTYDVSPITSSAPANLGYMGGGHVTSGAPVIPPPPLALISGGGGGGGHAPSSAPSPLFGNPAFAVSGGGVGGLPPLHPPCPSPSPLLHETTAASSPCPSDGGFFSPHSNYGSLANTPNQEAMPFFPAPHPPPPLPPPPGLPLPLPLTSQPGSLYSHPYSHAHDFTSNAFSIAAGFQDLVSSEAGCLANFGLQIPDIMDLGGHALSSAPSSSSASSCPIPPLTSDTKFPGYGAEVVGKGQGAMGEGPCPLDGGTKVASPGDVKTEQGLSGLCPYEDALDMACTGGMPVSMTSPTAMGSVVASSPPATSMATFAAAGTPTNLEGEGEEVGKGQCSVTHYRYSKDMNVTVAPLPGKKPKNSSSSGSGHGGGMTRVGKAAMKAAQKKKTQWPRSMNRANLIAFREHILSKLKRAQESGGPVPGGSEEGEEVSIQVLSNSSTATPTSSVTTPPATSSSSSSSSPAKFKALSPNSAPFEVQVKYERNNHLAPPKRCHSEPADCSSGGGETGPVTLSAGALQNCHSDSNIAGTGGGCGSSGLSCTEEMRLLCMGDCPSTAGAGADLLSELNFNPDTFLAPSEDRKLLNDLELKFNMEGTPDEEAGSILGLFEDDEGAGKGGVGHYPSSSSLSDVEGIDMDMDCINNLLDTSKAPSPPPPPHSTTMQVFSGSPSPLGSPPLSARQQGSGSGDHTPLMLDSTPTNLSRSNSFCSVVPEGASDPAGASPGRKGELSEDAMPTPSSSSFKFPEILSIQGSMVLDGVSVLTGEGPTGMCHDQHGFLQSHFDPLLADDHPTPCSVELLEF